MNLYLSKASGPDCVLNNCEPELSYKLAKLFNRCLKESYFPDCWKVSSVVPVFKNIGERSMAKNYRLVSLLSVISKVFEKLVNNRIFDHLEKCGFSSDFQYGFRSSRSTANLLTVVSDRIAWAFDRSVATVALNISKAFDRVWHAGLLHKLKSYGIPGQILGVIFSFLSNRRLRVALDGKSSQEYPVNAGVPQGPILGPTIFLLYINDFPDDVIYDVAICADDTTLYSKCDQASDLVLHLLLLLNPWLIVSLSLFDRYYFGRCSSELAQLVPVPFSRERSTLYSDRLHDFSVIIPRCYMDVYINGFFPRTARVWNSLLIECFPLTNDLSGFKSRISRRLSSVGSF